MTTKQNSYPASELQRLKSMEFIFTEGAYVLTMDNVLINGMSLVQIGLQGKKEVIKIVISYDLSKLVDVNYNVVKNAWKILTSRRKLKTMQAAMTIISKEDKLYLV
jgi:hypothetical protein